MASVQTVSEPAGVIESGVEFRVLGPVEFNGSQAPVALGGPKQRAILALLIKEVGQVVTSESLIDGVWGEEVPSAVRTSLHTYISNLRSIIGDRIERTGSGYRLGVDPSNVDANVFEAMADEGASSLTVNPSKAAQILRAALSLWRGRPYADLIDVPALQDEIRRLEDLRLLTVENRIDADLSLGRHRPVIDELEALAAEYPLREGLRARHMIALYRDGRQSEALRAYQRTRDYLTTELGVDPSPELQQVEERVLQHDPNLLSSRDVRSEEVAFLFTDIEGSTVLWETRLEQMRDALVTHDEILTAAVTDAGGRVFKHTGDGMLAAFGSVPDAAQAAAQAQETIQGTDWGELGDIKVRMSVDVGEVEARGGDYFGAPMNRGARLMNASHGGQIVLSAPANEQLQHQAGVQVRSLGEHRFKGLGAPQQVFQLMVSGLESDFSDLQVDADTAGDAERQFGDAIRGYEIRERIGQGRFGVVYRAYQPSVGREVAVKVIRPEFANHPSFVRRFESEARLVAKLEHPHIVSLYDFWRDHEGAYLVMPYLAGKSLAGGAYGALPLERVTAIMRQVGSGLAFAHRQGVVHRDIKPANILLDTEGNAYLADFGIAVRTMEQATGVLPPSQIYRAPEDRDGTAVDQRSDVYSLGAVTAELLAGRMPSEGEMPELPAKVQGLVRKAMDQSPDRRFATIDEFLASLVAAGGEAPTMPATPVAYRNPYKGLAPFEEGDARDFFGRDDEVAALLKLVESQRFVTVVGASGCGKSSLVRAGLVPALRTGRLAGSTEWLIVTAVPGAHPFDELATAILDVATEGLGELATELSSDDHGLMRVSKRLMRDLDGELVIVIDQFEELYSLVTDDELRSAFVASLLAASEDPHSRVRIVTTIRADFFDQPLLDDRLGAVVSSSHLALSVPGPDALLEAVERPASGGGLRLEAGLSNQIVADVREEPGGLPLMQFVLADLVAQAEEGRVGLAAYRDAGGVTGALSQRATSVYEGLDPADREIAEQMFLRMVTVTDDADDVRRRVRRSELTSLGLDAGSVDRVLAAFGSARLLTFDRDPVTRGPTVEVAHEALLREWGLFRQWVTERRGALLTQRRFVLAMEEWESSDRATDRLPAGGRLVQFEDWVADPLVTLTDQERAFLVNAQGLRNRETADRRKRRRAVMAGFAAAAVVAMVLAVAAWVQRGDAQTQAALATARGWILESEKILELDPELSASIALAAIDTFQQAGEVPASAVSALRAAVAEDRVVARIPGGGFAAAHPDGTLIATAAEEGVAVWDLTTGELEDTFARDGVAIGAAFSPDGKLLAAVFPLSVPPITVWNLETRESFSLGSSPLLDKDGGVWFLDFSPNGELLVSVSSNAESETVTVWSIIEPPAVTYEATELFVGIAEFDSAGLIVHSYGDVEAFSEFGVRVVDPLTGQLVREYPVTDVFPQFTVPSPDGTRIAVGDEQTVVVLDAATGAEISRADFDRAFRPEWLPTSDAFLVGGESALRIVDAATGETLTELAGQAAIKWSYRIVPGTTLAASAGLTSGGVSNGETVIFDVGPEAGIELGGWVAPVPEVFGVSFAGDGSRLALPGPDYFASVGALHGRDPIVVQGTSGELTGGPPFTTGAGTLVALAEQDGGWTARDTVTTEVAYRAPDGWWIQAMSSDGMLAVIQTAVGPSDDACGPTRLVAAGDGIDGVDLDDGCSSLATFSPDGTLAAIWGFGGDVSVFETGSGALVAQPSGYAAFKVAFTPAGDRMIVGSFDTNVYFLDVPALRSGVPPEESLIRKIAAHDFPVNQVVISPDGTIVATAAFTEPFKFWDVETGELLEQFGSVSEGLAFHPTLPQLAVVTEPNIVRIHTLDLDELINIAQSRLSRDMTEDECQQYFRSSCENAR